MSLDQHRLLVFQVKSLAPICGQIQSYQNSMFIRVKNPGTFIFFALNGDYNLVQQCISLNLFFRSEMLGQMSYARRNFSVIVIIANAILAFEYKTLLFCVELNR